MITHKISIDATSLKEIIKEYVERSGQKLKGVIEIDVGMDYQGFGTSEHQVATFRCITYTIEAKT